MAIAVGDARDFDGTLGAVTHYLLPRRKILHYHSSLAANFHLASFVWSPALSLP
ncbi:MAG: hypothetical protein ABSG32_00460 [Terriglobia bacterium]